MGDTMAADDLKSGKSASYCSFDSRETASRQSIDAAAGKIAQGRALGRLVSQVKTGAGRAIERVIRKAPEAPATTAAKESSVARPPASSASSASSGSQREQTVFAHELLAIGRRRKANGRDGFNTGETASPQVGHKLTGLCLSGGGLRSATFSLGALQALYEADCGKRKSKSEDRENGGQGQPPMAESQPSDLPMIDYVSGVSGGNYIASSMSLGMTRSNGKFPFSEEVNGAKETLTMRHLRDNSRYLLPGGVLSIIPFVFVYLRGVVAGLMCILPPLIAIAAALALIFPDQWFLESPPWAVGRWAMAYDSAYIPIISDAAIWVLSWLAIFAVTYSIFPPFRSYRARAFITTVGAVVMGGPLLAALLVEGHAALLRAYFVSDQTLVSPFHGASSSTITLEKLRNWAQTVAPFFFALATLALPFIKKISESAAQTNQKSLGGKIASILSRITLPVLALIVPFLLWLFMMIMAISMIENGYFLFEAATPRRWLVGAAAVFAISFFVIDYNVNSLHNIYRDRMSRAFLVSAEALAEPDKDKRKQRLKDDDLIPLSDISTDHAPYHLINTALNIPGSAWANQRGRNADFFIYSPRFIGGELTGYIGTAYAQGRVSAFNLGSAMAVSGAAVAPNMGMFSVRMMSITLAVLNLRLGRWAANPRHLRHDTSSKFLHFPGARHFLREAFNKPGIGSKDNGRGAAGAALESGADKPFVYLSDGGHIENLGAYELLRRRCRLIICVDGECDPDLSAGALAQLERFARIDLGTRLHIDVSPIAITHQAASKAMSKETEPLKPTEAHNGPHVALGMIEYPASKPGGKSEIGAFLYVKSSLSGDENAYVAAYKTEHPAFPHETTGDQFFSEEQFECYRALGEHILRRALKGEDPVTIPGVFISPRQERAIIRIVEDSLPGATIRKYVAADPKPAPQAPAAQAPAGSKPKVRKRGAAADKAEAKLRPSGKAAKSARTAKS
jgi:hypothetical protein